MTTNRTVRALLLATTLLAASLAGCIGNDDDPIDPEDSVDETPEIEPPYESFEAAMAADGRVFEPEDNGTDTRLKVLSPAKLTGLEADKTNITFLLFDEASNTPIEDANATIKGWMPAMGHGTSPEEDPVHLAHGIYQGMTTFTMEGQWLINLDAALSDGTAHHFEVLVGVGEGGGAVDPNIEPEHHRFEDTFEDTVTDVQYAQNWTFPVEAEGAHAWINMSLNDTSPLDELVVRLLDAGGSELSSKTLTEEDPSVAFDVANTPNVGDYTLEITGRALETAYLATVVVTWTTMPEDPMAGMDHGDDDHGHEH